VTDRRRVYRRSDGYGIIDTKAPRFQLGCRLFEVQSLLHQVKCGDLIEPDKVRQVCEWYEDLAVLLLRLKTDYEIMRSCAEGKAEYRSDE
jgi:hypothetical protein